MSLEENYIVMGQFGAAHGIKGQVRVQSFTRPENNLFDYEPWFIEQQGEWKKIPVESISRHAKKWVVQLSNCEDRTTAERFTGKAIAVLRESLPEPEDGSFYWHDLIGLQVVDKNGTLLGTVKDFLETGANDVMIVQTNTKEELIPFVFEHFILKVAKEQNKIVVDWVSEE